MDRTKRDNHLVGGLKNRTTPNFQAQSQYFIAGVNPGTSTTVRLAGGKYCLGSESTVPFISLEGGGYSQKIISWGEVVEVPQSQMVTIKNESFHKGDIVINSGWDYATRPAKITIPVGIIDLATGLQLNTPVLAPVTIGPEFPVDCRLSRRVYVIPNLVTDLDDINFSIIGRNVKHSFPSSNIQNSYFRDQVLPAATEIGPIPLGASSNDNLPMALTDFVTFQSLFPSFSEFIPVWFYVVEY